MRKILALLLGFFVIVSPGLALSAPGGDRPEPVVNFGSIDVQNPMPGESVRVSYPAGTFDPNVEVRIALLNPPDTEGTEVGRPQSGDDGSLIYDFVVPVGAEVGAIQVEAGHESGIVRTPITISADYVTAATDIDYEQPGQFDMEPCSSDVDSDCIESTGYYTDEGMLVKAGFLANADDPGFTCEDGHISNHSGSYWNFPGLETERDDPTVLVGPALTTPNFNHRCSRPSSRDGSESLAMESVYISLYGAHNHGNGSFNQASTSAEDCPTGFSCTTGAGPGEARFEITLRVSNFAAAFAYATMSDLDVAFEEDETFTRMIVSGRAQGVPGVWDSESYSEGSLRTANQADYIAQRWDIQLKNANDPGFPDRCGEFGFPIVAGNHAWGGQPVWDSQAEELLFNMGAPHLRPDGDPFEGSYEARIPVAYAECLWGIDPASLVTDLEVIVEDEGVVRDSSEFEASIRIVDDLLHIDADGFHFSEPDVVVRQVGGGSGGQVVGSGGSFSGFTPVRILNTRDDGVSRVGNVSGTGTPYRLKVAGLNGVPEGVSAVALNVTATETTGDSWGGFVTVYPCSAEIPKRTSNVNFLTGQTVANSVIAPVSSDGEVCFFVWGQAHLLADISGYFN